MIRIHRTPECPGILASKGEAARAQLCEAVDGGESPRRFNDKIYGDASVRARLSADQHGKCCYCERRLDRETIDHYRPIGAVQQSRSERATPGYYWLAYEWHNLLLACSACNETHKRDWFPLADPSARVRHHAEASRLNDERPLLVNPAAEDPEHHIGYAGQTPVARTERGRRTIEILRLDRPVLEESRGRVLEEIETLWRLLEISRRLACPTALVSDVCEKLVRYTSPNEPYAGVIRQALRGRLGAETTFPLALEALRSRFLPDG